MIAGSSAHSHDGSSTPTGRPTPAKRKRVRTESQLDQKRLTDRIKHRENRQDSKRRLERMERDIAEIKAAVGALTLRSQPTTVHQSVSQVSSTLPPSPPPPLAPTSFMFANGIAHGMASASYSAHSNFFSSLPQPPQPGASVLTSPPTPITRLWPTTVASEPGPTKLVNCRCGSQHLDRFDSLEQCNVAALYTLQLAMPHMQAAPGPLPRTPSLPSMLLLRTPEENVATLLITGFLQQYKSKSIEQLLGSYLLGYRYMRWRMFPCHETIRDVPTWLLPTEIQESHPHPLVVDYIAWPRMRDYLCTHGSEDPRLSLTSYFESVELLWPASRPMFAQGEGGQVSLSPDFEAVVGDLASWRLGPPWSQELPHLMSLTTP
jgi:hypothetical protein